MILQISFEPPVKFLCFVSDFNFASTSKYGQRPPGDIARRWIFSVGVDYGEKILVKRYVINPEKRAK